MEAAMYSGLRSMVQPVFCVLFIVGCKKAVEVDPPLSLITNRHAFADDRSAISVVNSIYIYLGQTENVAQGNSSIGQLTSLATDELQIVNAPTTGPAPFTYFYNNAVNPENIVRIFWADLYANLFTCNLSLEQIPLSPGISEPVKKQLTGEAKFMRAFFNFYLVNLFGDVPLLRSSDFQVNKALPRASAAQVYQLILEDLQDAFTLLSPTFVDGFVQPVLERVRPSKAAATALLARVYLYQQNWLAAEEQATRLINSTELILEPNLDSVFLRTSKEAILQFQPLLNGQNTQDAERYVWYSFLRLGSNYFGFSLPSRFHALFDLDDQRKRRWVRQNHFPASGAFPDTTFFTPFKYKLKSNVSMTTEYVMVMRMAEQYLIRAEARAQQNNLMGAKADLDLIRRRAGLPGVVASTKQAMLEAVDRERRVELFTEWGHRWFDLKRTGTIDSVMARIAVSKGTMWKQHFKLFPIPNREIQTNANLTQNPGY